MGKWIKREPNARLHECKPPWLWRVGWRSVWECDCGQQWTVFIGLRTGEKSWHRTDKNR